MKVFRFLSHPYTLIICFLLILISGEHWGGFYAIYILMAVPYGGTHALFAVLGIFVILISHFSFNRSPVNQILNWIGVALMFLSLYTFFTKDYQHYNWGTFEEVIPVLSIATTVIVAICFLANGLVTKKAGKSLML